MDKKSPKSLPPETELSGPMSISESEWLLLELLWAKAPQGSQELVGELAESKGWARSTTITLLQRLIKKGAVKAVPKGSRFIYEPAVERATCVTAEATSFLDRLFGGSLHPFVAHFAKQQRLTKQDVTELRALLDTIDAPKKHRS